MIALSYLAGQLDIPLDELKTVAAVELDPDDYDSAALTVTVAGAGRLQIHFRGGANTRTVLKVQNHGGEDFGEFAHQLVDLYRTVYAERLDEPHFTLQNFGARLAADAERDGFAFTTGHVRDELVGYALGFRLPTNTDWWQGLITPVDPKLIHEDGKRTFAITQLMVAPNHRRKGYAALVHDTLLITRPFERRSTVLVEPTNEPALAACRSWEYQTIGQLRPSPGAPVCLAMIKDPP